LNQSDVAKIEAMKVMERGWQYQAVMLKISTYAVVKEMMIKDNLQVSNRHAVVKLTSHEDRVRLESSLVK